MTQRGHAGARPGDRRNSARTRGAATNKATNKATDKATHKATDKATSKATDKSRGAGTDEFRAAPRVDLAAARVRVREVIEPVVAAAGYDLEDVNLSRAGRRHVVRVLVDADGGVTLDDVAVVSRDISAALDEADEESGEVLPGEYQLEVGSPGVDRPLTLPRHWRRNVGRLVAVNGVTGRVLAAGDQGVELDVDGVSRTLAYPELGPGKVQIEFKRLDDDVDLDEDEDEGEGEEK